MSLFFRQNKFPRNAKNVIRKHALIHRKTYCTFHATLWLSTLQGFTFANELLNLFRVK